MYRFEDIREVHLEPTSRCNARCPQCPRNIQGGKVNPDLPLTELRIAQVREIFSARFLTQLRHIYLCGNYGDPIAASDTLDMLRYFRRVNPSLQLTMFSNGSARPPEWWAEAARLLSACRFGIDGLEDTNHLYRRNTRWATIMTNVRAFIAAGGVAEWDYLVFAHNEHQVDGARTLAMRLGFKKFFVKKTSRFTRAGRLTDQTEVLSRTGESEALLRPPGNIALRNPGTAELASIVSSLADYSRYIETTPIRCKVADRGSVFISAEGLVLPCCFLANIYAPHDPAWSNQVWRLIERLPERRRSITAPTYSVQEIVNSELFQQLIPDGWRAGRQDRLRTCAHHCGKIDMDAAQYSPSSR
jgi:MoaA/NifB/PqqE/SkfB family radical SAM enzyme